MVEIIQSPGGVRLLIEAGNEVEHEILTNEISYTRNLSNYSTNPKYYS